MLKNYQLLIITFTLFFSSISSGQIGIGTIAPDPSSILEIQSNSKGFLLPRMVSPNAIVNPATGLMIYNTSDDCIQVNIGIPSAPNWKCLNGEDSQVVAQTPGTLLTEFLFPRRIFIHSVNDDDYLPFEGDESVTNADGNTSTNGNEVALNKSFTLTAGASNDIAVSVDYFVSKTTVLPAGSFDLVIPSQYVSNDSGGSDNTVTLSWSETTLTPPSSARKRFRFYIRSKSGNLTFSQLDINRDIGNDMLGVLLGTFETSIGDLELRLHPGIPDKASNLPTSGPNANASHPFIYMPIQDFVGNVWLNTNLGANVNNPNLGVFEPNFNVDPNELENLSFPSPISTSTNADLYGSSFRNGQFPNGQEFPNIDGTRTISGTVSGAQYNYSAGWDNSDVNEPNVTNISNPCPLGFEVPENTDVYSSLDWLAQWNLASNVNEAIVEEWAGFYYGRTYNHSEGLEVNGTSNQAGSYGLSWWSRTRVPVTSSPGTFQAFAIETQSGVGLVVQRRGLDAGRPVRCVLK